MTSKVIATKQVKAQASPIPEIGLTPLKVYDAIAETMEYTRTFRYERAKGTYTETSTGTNYVVVDDNGNARRFGPEFFRQV